MKTCVSTYSFGPYVESLGMEGVIAKAAEMGFSGIEFVDGAWTNHLSYETAVKLRSLAEEKNLTIVSYCTGADFLNGSNGVLSDEINRLHAQIDFTKALGAPNMRHDTAWTVQNPNGKYGIGFDSVLLRLAEGCREVTKYAEQQGVGTMTENHGYFVQDACRVEKLINTVAHPNFGALVAIGNFMCADEEPFRSVGILARYAKHVHAKDFHFKSGLEPDPGRGWFRTRGMNYLRGAIIGHGVVGVPQCLSVLQNAGYDGFVSVEFEGIEDHLLGISIGLENLNKYPQFR